MDISSLVKAGLQSAQLNQTSGSTAAGTVSKLKAPATKRLTEQLESTNVKLSAYGQIKSAFAGAQTAASALSSSATSKTATNADVEKAAQAFVDAYNKGVKTVSNATASSTKQTGALASDQRAKSAGSDLARSVASGTGPANLKQAGITQNTDGTLSLDNKALQQALQANSSQTKSALASLGQQVSTTTGRELASTGNVGASVGKLASRAETLAAQQTAVDQQAASLQASLEKQSAALDYATANGLAAYRKVLT